MDTAIVVFTRDLRLHDNPAQHLACARARQVVPLFVLDPASGSTGPASMSAATCRNWRASTPPGSRRRGAAPHPAGPAGLPGPAGGAVLNRPRPVRPFIRP